MDVIIYVVDALRADRLSGLGYQRNTTPFLDQLIKDSVLFQKCFTTATWTRPVAASLLTGLYPPAHKVRQRDNILSRSIPRLPGILRDAGWYTVAISAMSNVSRATGFDAGFEEFFDLYLDPKLLARRRASDVVGEDFRVTTNVTEISLPWAEDVVEKFMEWHEKWSASVANDRFFTLLWTIDTHIPYDCPDEFQLFGDPAYSGAVDGSRQSLEHIRSERDKQHLQDLYDNQVRYSDFNVGVLIDYLKRRKLYDDSLLIVLGDHGEAFWEHGQFGHGLLPFDEILRVPLIVKLPQQEHAGTRVDGLVSLTDLFATVLACANLFDEEDISRTVQSENLLPLIGKKISAIHEATFSETQPTQLHGKQVSVRTLDWKYIETKNGNNVRNVGIGEIWYQFIHRGLWRRLLLKPINTLRRWYSPVQNRLYNVSTDPDEQSNVHEIRPDVVAHMKGLLQNWEEECRQSALGLHSKSIKSDLDEETWQQLRALGYVD